MGVRITTWNVNGIRNPFGYQPWRDRRTFEGMFDILEADIVIMQELKIQRKDLTDDMVLVPGWDCYYSLPRHKKGYSGVGIYTRQSKCAPIRAEEGVLGVLCPPNKNVPYCKLPDTEHIGGYLSDDQLEVLGVDAAELDAEGRCVILEFPAFVLFGIYSPANSSGTRDDFRFGFINALDMRIRNTVALGKRVVVTGDLNVSRAEIDTAKAGEAMRKEGITHEDYISAPNRRIFNQLIEDGEVLGERDAGREDSVLWDICRGFHPTRSGMFTHWEQKINARPGNFGARIDFVLCSLDMKFWFCESDIQEGLMGSDHCPVYAVIKDQVELQGASTHIEDIMNPPGVFKDGQRVQDYSVKMMPAFSAKLLPEFTNRRSIKDMFGKGTSLKAEPSLETSPAAVEHTASADGAQANILTAEAADEDPSKKHDSSSRISSQATAAPASVASSASPDRKRSAPDTASARSLKRNKASSIVAPVPPAPGKAQQSLKGFFKPKTTSSDSSEKVEVTLSTAGRVAAGSHPDEPPSNGSLTSSTAISSTNLEVPTQPESADTVHAAPLPPPPLDLQADEIDPDEEFVDPIVSKESWAKVFTKRPDPRCEGHSEPCKMMKTKKAGINCGREFWMCARPLGPSGDKERGTQWRCPTFIWRSDWAGGTNK